MDKWSPTNSVLVFPDPHILSQQTEYSRDNLSVETKFLGTICPWGPNWLGTICPEGPINWGPNVGDQMSRDHMGMGSYVSQLFLGEIIMFLQKEINPIMPLNFSSLCCGRSKSLHQKLLVWRNRSWCLFLGRQYPNSYPQGLGCTLSACWSVLGPSQIRYL